MGKLLRSIVQWPKRAALFGISLYQATVSPDHGWLRSRYPYGFCRHYPSCSEYARQAIVKFGLIKGGFLAAKRLAKCNPLAVPSVDPVPQV